MLDGRWRLGVERVTAPVSAALRRTGVTPDQLTGLGLVLAAGAGAAIAVGDLIAGAVLIGLCGLADLLDGPLAKASGLSSIRGAFFDSVADRLSDIFLLAGVAWYLGNVGSSHSAVLALGVLAASMLPSYIRAKADTLGLTARGGIMERAERMIVLGVAIFVQAFVSVPVLVPTLWLILALSLLTAIQRFAGAWRQASAGMAGRAADAAAVAGADLGSRVAEVTISTDRARRAIHDGPGERASRPHLRGSPVRHSREPGLGWRAERSYRLGGAERPGARPGSRRRGFGGGDPRA